MTEVERAFAARERAYAPYSGFRVGALLVGKSGTAYTGCNIENAAYSPTLCAERAAFAKAISEGEREFSRIVIVGGKERCALCPPCGVCRQFMREFCKDDFQIILADDRGGSKTYSLGELLPDSFGKESL